MINTKIYFLCPNNNLKSGGTKQIYRQVETLNKNGFKAFVLLQDKKKQKWFHSNAPIAYSPHLFKILKYTLLNRKKGLLEKLKLWYLKKKSVILDDDTILVFPEIYGDKIHTIAPKTKKVIFNQNCYYTFNHYLFEKDYEQNPYNNPNILATIVVSENSLTYMNSTFGSSQFYKLTLGIDSSIFSYSDKKQKQICFMPRKLSDDIRQVILILKQKENLKNWKFISIENMTEREVAQIMKESILFLSFNHREGFGLPPAEAMACGCYVIGYHGQGGKEYFKHDFSSVIEDGNIIEYVKKIEEITMVYEKNPNLILEKGRQASEFILSNYSIKKEEESTINIWNNILKPKQSL